ncbi:MAG TPA: carboxypeptidase-like regulatory domain-containing protein [Solirubrobacteraceae bacterium]
MPVLAIGALCVAPTSALAVISPPHPPKLIPASTAAPTLAGTPAVGQTLSCSTGAWTNDPNGFAYAWLRNGVPIAGATASTYVLQEADEGESIACDVTASDLGGEYTITGLPSGSYKVAFYPQPEVSGSYLSQFFDGKAEEGEATLLSLTAPLLTPNIDASLPSGGEVSGRVTNQSGAAVAEVYVCASETAPPDFLECVYTNADGEYTVAGLPAGSYTVEFYNEAYVEQFYDKVSHSTEAAAIPVTPANATPGINAVLEALPTPETGAIAGVVENAAKTARLEHVEVCVNSSLCEATNQNGEYRFASVPVGEYGIEFTPEQETGNYLPRYYDEKVKFSEGELLTVTASKTSTADAKLQEGGEIAGTVTNEASARLANIEVCAYDYTVEVPSVCTVTNEKGEYKIVGREEDDKYEVSVLAYGTNYLPQNSPSLESVSIKKSTPVNFTLEEGGRISGKVTNAAGVPLANDRVCAEEAADSFAECEESNVNGEYAIPGLPTGSYTVTFPGNQCTGVGGEYSCVEIYLAQTVASVSVTQKETTPNVDATLVEGAKISGKVTGAATGALVPEVEVCVTGTYFRCTYTGEVGGSASATSNALAIPAPKSSFSLLKKPVFNAKSGVLVFSFKFPEAGLLSWALSFKNSDVAFADDLAISSGEAFAAAAKKKGRKGGKAKHCKKGLIKHKGRCVHATVPFSSGSKQVAAGTVQVKVKPSKKAQKALKSGHTLHVSGTFTFKSALGGAPATVNVKAVVREPKKPKKKAKQHKQKR